MAFVDPDANDGNGWQIDPRVQRERDQRALAIIEDELAADPNNPYLRRDAENARKRVGGQAVQRVAFVDPDATASQGGFADPDGATPARKGRTLDERMADRGALQVKADTLAKQIQSLEEALAGIESGQEGQLPEAIAAMRREQEKLRAQIESTGYGQKGRIIGSTVGSILGGVGGGALGSLASPAGTVAGAMGGSVAGTGIGSWLGSQYDLARATDITEDEAARLLESQVAEDMAWDAAGNALFFVGGKVLKVARASPQFKRFFDSVIGESAPKVAPRAPAPREYVKPGETGGLYTRGLEWATGAGNEVASGVNQRTVNEAVKRELGIPLNEPVTKEALEAVRKREGGAYARAKGIYGGFDVDDEFKDALARLRKEITAGGFPSTGAERNALQLLDDYKSMGVFGAEDAIEKSRQLRAAANRAFGSSDPDKHDLAVVQKGIADALETRLSRGMSADFPKQISDSSFAVKEARLMSDLARARATIAKSHNVEKALPGYGDVDARKLERLPTNGGIQTAAKNADEAPYAFKPPSIGASPAEKDARIEGLIKRGALGAVMGLGGAYGSENYAGVGFAALPFLTKPVGRAMLRRAYERAARAGDRAALREIGKLNAMAIHSQGKKASVAINTMAGTALMNAARYFEEGNE